VLYGRDAECAALASLVGEARAGRGGALVVLGREGGALSALLPLFRLGLGVGHAVDFYAPLVQQTDDPTLV